MLPMLEMQSISRIISARLNAWHSRQRGASRRKSCGKAVPMVRQTICIGILTFAALTSRNGWAQTKEKYSEEQLSRLLRRFPQADANRDGKLTQGEAEEYRKARSKEK